MTPDYRFMKPSPQTQDTASDRQWYIRVTGRVYGPFDDRTVWTYVQEGRVTAQSDLSLHPERGYLPAKDWLEIAHWFHAPIAAMQAPAPHSEPEPVAELPEPARLSLSLVVADIRSGRVRPFEQTLHSLGTARALSSSAWLVEANMDVEQMKLILGPALSVTDRLLILDATDADFAAYNLEEDMDAPHPTTPPSRGLWR